MASAAASALFWSGALALASVGAPFLLMAICTLALLSAMIIMEPPPESLPTRHRVRRVVAPAAPTVVLVLGVALT